MASEVEIMRMALDLLGDFAISDPDEDSKQARLCNRNYAPMRDATLRAHPWNCALKRDALAADSVKPAFGFENQFTLPADCLRLLPLTVEGSFDGRPIDHVIEGRKLLVNADAPLPVIYIQRVTNAGQFDPLLVTAIAARLAWQIAFNLTGSRSMQDQMAATYRAVMRDARRIDGMEGTLEDRTFSSWEDSRV